MTNQYGMNTLAVHAGQVADPTTGACALPIYQTASYVFGSTQDAADVFALKKSGNIYTRLMNPTTDVFEKRMAALNGGVGALATSSGMSAIFLAVVTLCKAGDHIICSSSVYGGTGTLFGHTLKRFGIETTFIPEITAEKIKAAVQPNSKLVFAEMIGNPKGDILDIEKIAAAAHELKLPLFVDNTFAPIVTRPIDYGADVVVYSCTKWIGGHGSSLGGMIVDSGRFDWSSGRFPEFTTPDESYHGLIYWEQFGNVRDVGNIAFIMRARVQGLRDFGPCISPTNAWLLVQGLESLPFRIKAHGENTLKLALWLKKHPNILWVNYAGLPDHPSHQLAKKYLKNDFYGAVLSFGIKGGAEAATRFIDRVQLACHLANVGDAKTLVIHAWSTTHQQLDDQSKLACGITNDAIRVSVGLEDIEDLEADFDQALRS